MIRTFDAHHQRMDRLKLRICYKEILSSVDILYEYYLECNTEESVAKNIINNLYLLFFLFSDQLRMISFLASGKLKTFVRKNKL